MSTEALWSDLLGAFGSVGAQRPWFAEGAIEGNPIVMFSGPEKSHKSWTGMQLAVATVIGGAWLGRFQIQRPGSVVYLDSEYGPHEFARRLARIARGLGRDPREVLREIRHRYSVDLTLVRNDDTLRKVIADVSANKPALIVVDPLRNHLDGSENDSDAIVRAYRCLDLLRTAGGCPVLVIHHLNKSGGFSGSRAITTRADLIIEGSDGQDPSYTVRGRTVRPTLDPIARPFRIEIAHVNDGDDGIAATTLAWAPDAAAPAALPPGVRPLGGKILSYLRGQTQPRAANYLAKAEAVNRSGTDVKAELIRLHELGLVHITRFAFDGKMLDGWCIGPDERPDDGDPDVGADEHQPSGGSDRGSGTFAAASAPDEGPDEHQTPPPDDDGKARSASPRLGEVE